MLTVSSFKPIAVSYNKRQVNQQTNPNELNFKGKKELPKWTLQIVGQTIQEAMRIHPDVMGERFCPEVEKPIERFFEDSNAYISLSKKSGDAGYEATMCDSWTDRNISKSVLGQTSKQAVLNLVDSYAKGTLVVEKLKYTTLPPALAAKVQKAREVLAAFEQGLNAITMKLSLEDKRKATIYGHSKLMSKPRYMTDYYGTLGVFS